LAELPAEVRQGAENPWWMIAQEVQLPEFEIGTLLALMQLQDLGAL
jgi:hypothetical protein